MTIIKDKRSWLYNGKPLDLYQLYWVWLSSAAVQAKYPGVRPSGVTAEMVRQYLEDNCIYS